MDGSPSWEGDVGDTWALSEREGVTGRLSLVGGPPHLWVRLAQPGRGLLAQRPATPPQRTRGGGVRSTPGRTRKPPWAAHAPRSLLKLVHAQGLVHAQAASPEDEAAQFGEIVKEDQGHWPHLVPLQPVRGNIALRSLHQRRQGRAAPVEVALSPHNAFPAARGHADFRAARHTRCCVGVRVGGSIHAPHVLTQGTALSGALLRVPVHRGPPRSSVARATRFRSHLCRGSA